MIKPLSRRHILAAGTAGGVVAATAMASAAQAATQAATQAAAGAALATSNPGPQSNAYAQLNPTAFAPAGTDHGNLGMLKYSFSEAQNRRTDAGWAREVTVRDFPIAKAIAGVNMRLEAGGVRELHWHLPPEWAYMIDGRARITAVDQDGRHFVEDVAAGDLWFFPSGIPHSIQGLGPDGCEFLLAFPDGHFSENSTFLITDWMEHTPRDVLAKNFGVPAADFDKVPPHELYIFNAPLPGTLASDAAQSARPAVPDSYKFPLAAQKPIQTRGGAVRIADMNNFKASSTMSAALVEVEPGGMREMHWHPTSDEWQYYISGSARMTVFASQGTANTVEFGASDVGYVPRAMGHYVENTGKDTLRFLEIFAVGQYADISLTNWIANTPRELVQAHLGLSTAMLAKLSQAKNPVVPV